MKRTISTMSDEVGSQADTEANELRAAGLRLEEIFISATNGDKDFPVEEAMNLLRRHIHLTHSTENRLPLSHFIEARASLEEIRELSQLILKACGKNAPSAQQRDFSHLGTIFDFCCIWEACGHGAQEGVFEFLLQELMPALEPALFSPPKIAGRIVSFLSDIRADEQRLRMLKLIFQAYPDLVFGDLSDGVVLDRNTFFTSVLMHALRRPLELGTELMNLVFQECRNYLQKNYPQGVEAFLRIEHITISHAQAVAMSILLPCFSEIHMVDEFWTQEALVYFLGELGKNTTVKIFGLDFSSHTFGREACGALQNMLETNHTISKLNLESSEGDSDVQDDDIFQAVASGLSLRPSLEDLSIRYFLLSDSDAFCHLLTQCGLKKVGCDAIELDGSWNHCKFQPDCPLESVIVHRSDLGSESLTGLIAQIHTIPKLKAFVLTHEDVSEEPRKLTLPLQKSLGSHVCNIQRLFLTNVIIDVGILQAILMNNKNLVNLKLKNINPYTYKATVACVVSHLEYHSSMLTTCNLMDSGSGTYDRAIFEDLMKIKYYVALNQDGKRTQAHNQEITQEGFLGLLCDVVTLPPNRKVKDTLECRGGDYELNMHYGLLKTNPHLWSGLRAIMDH